MYEYSCKINRVVDGDTVDVDIDLGFGIWIRDERVRVVGIDTPESRTRDTVEKVFGLAAKKRLKELLSGAVTLKTQKDEKGKFGRVLGDFQVYYSTEDRWTTVTEILIKEGHAVPYHGQSKEDVEQLHLLNRERLIKEGVVSIK